MPENVATQPFVRRKASHVHPRLVRALDSNAFFPMTVTIQTQDTNDRTPSGGFNSPGAWTDVAGLADIPARRGVPQSSERQANELTRDWGRVDRDMYVIVLNGYYPDVRAFMRAVTSDGVFVDIRGVLSDSALHITTITGRTIDPGTEGFG